MSAAAWLRNSATRCEEVRWSLRPPTRWRMVSFLHVRPAAVSGTASRAVVMGAPPKLPKPNLVVPDLIRDPEPQATSPAALVLTFVRMTILAAHAARIVNI